MKTNTGTSEIVAALNNACLKKETGYTLLELLVALAVLSLLTLTLLSTGFGGRDPLSQVAYEAECEEILYTLLQYQNESIMDGYRREVRFRDAGIQIIWTINGVIHRDYIPVETMTFAGDYTAGDVLIFYDHGTVSRAGTLSLQGHNGMIRKIIFQLGNGRIYLNEP